MTKKQSETLMKAALREAQRGMSAGEAPIGCVIAVRSGRRYRIVARGYNTVNASQRKIAHAENVTFEHASRRDKRGRPALSLSARNVVLVSTLEPCVMCLGAAMEAGIDCIVYGLRAPADNGTERVKPPRSPESSNPVIKGGVLASESRELFVKWLSLNEGTEQAKFVRQLLKSTASH